SDSLTRLHSPFYLHFIFYLFFLLIRPLPRSTLFPYTTLFRSQLERALDNKCMFDGSSIEGFVRIEESDMYLYPDLNTFEILPWRPQHGRVARFMCDVYRPEGIPFEGDSRHVLKKVDRKSTRLNSSHVSI